MDCSLQGSFVHGISLARILEWDAISFSRAPSRSRDQIHISVSPALLGEFFTIARPGKPIHQLLTQVYLGFSGGSAVKNPPAMQEIQEMQVQSLGWEDTLDEGIATHSSILDWRIPWTEEPGGLQSKASQRVGQDWSDWAHMHVCSGQLFSNQSQLFSAVWRGSILIFSITHILLQRKRKIT